jgi:hypothetical protein
MININRKKRSEYFERANHEREGRKKKKKRKERN